ncbi:hypothetical protein [Pantoea sp. B65]|uniref:hypothetical protein n=1 Tax=Pantoea sp. B65 TaxID=2813359 RepID=UPI0039B4F98E
MGFFDILNANKRSRLIAQMNYNNCYNHMRSRIESFRSNSLRYLSFKYPDSVILMNNNFPTFLLYNKTTEEIHQGEFADKYSPLLEFIPNDEPSLSFEIATENYKNMDRLWNSGKLIKDHYFYKNESWIRDFNRNGFYIKDSYRYDDPIKSDDFFGLALFLNGNIIGKSTVWNTEASGYFAEVLFDKIINTTISTTSGFSTITLVAGCFTLASEDGVGCCYPNKIIHEIIIGNGDRILDSNKMTNGAQAIIALRDFLNIIENKIGNNKSGVLPTISELSEDRDLCEKMLSTPLRKKNFPGIEDMYAR